MTVVHEDVGYFEIAVNNIFVSQVGQAFENILDDGSGLVLIEIAVFPESGLEVALVA